MGQTAIAGSVAGIQRALCVAATCCVLHGVSSSAAIPPHGYRGPQNNGIYPEKGLLKEWPVGGPPLLWKCRMPQGYAGVTVVDDAVYIASGVHSELHVLTLDGTLKHKIPVGPASWSRFGGTRSTPLIGGGVAVTTTPNANIYAIDLETRQIRWQHNAWKSFGAGKGGMGWGLPESPVLNNDAVIFNTCSRFDETPPFIALDIRTGRPVWFADAGVGKKYSAGDVSGAAFTHNGRDLYVHPSWRYLVCLEARTGKLLWEIPSAGEKCVTPMYNDGYLFSQINSGAVMLKLSSDGNSCSRVWTRRAGVPGFSHGVMLDGRLYTFGNPYVAEQAADPFSTSLDDEGAVLVFSPSDALAPDDVKEQGAKAIDRWKRDASRTTHVLCIDVKTGRVLQSRPAAHAGHMIAADGMVYVLERVQQKDGAYLPRVSLLRPTGKGFETAGELMPEMTAEELTWKSMKDSNSEQRRRWSSEDFSFQINVNPVIARGRLFLRYGPLMVFDLRKNRTAEHRQEPPPAAHATAVDIQPAITDTNLTQFTNAQVDRLVDQFSSRFEDERNVAVTLLARLDRKRRSELADRLVTLIKPDGDCPWPRQVCAARVLRDMGPLAKGGASDLRKLMLEALRAGDGTLAGLVADTLDSVSPGSLESSVSKIARTLRSRDPHIQFITAQMLTGIGSNATDAVDELVDVLDSENKNVVREAGAALIAMGPAAADGASDLQDLLAKALEGKRSTLSHLVVTILERIGGDALRRAGARAGKLLTHEDADVRYLAARTLGRTGAPPDVAGELVAALVSGDKRLAEQAAEALKRMGPDARTAAVRLADLVQTGRGLVRQTAAEIIPCIGPDAGPAVDALAAALDDKDIVLARVAAAGLKAIGPTAKGAVPALITAMKHRDTELVRSSAEALGAIGPDAEPAVTVLLNSLKHGDSTVRWNCVAALSSIGRPPVDALVAIMNEGDKHLAPWSAEALGRLGADAKDAVGALTEALVSKDERLVPTVVRALAGIGHDAASAVPSLITLSRTADRLLTDEIKRTLVAVKTTDAPPTVRDVTVTCEEGKSTVIELPVTDTDDVASVLTALVAKQPAHGITKQKSATSVLYSSTPGFTGEDIFTWRGRDTTNDSQTVTATITVTPDTTPPRLEKATAWGRNTRVTVLFDEPVAAGAVENYSVDNGVKIEAADTADDGRRVVLTTSALSEGKMYTLKIKAVSDRAKTPNTGSGTATFEHKPYVAGVGYVFYEAVPKGDDLARFEELEPKKTGTVTKFDASIRGRDTYFALLYRGLINVPVDGEYTFFASSDDGTRVYIDGNMIVQNDGMHATLERSGKTTLKAGLHPITVSFYQGMGPFEMKISWAGPGIEKTEIPPDVLLHVPAQ